jgi:hypothetical protein
MEVKVLERQSLFDLALQVCGTVEAVFEIADQNGMAVADRLTTGTTLRVLRTQGSNKLISDYYETRKLKPATDMDDGGSGSGGGGLQIDDGIDFMAVEVDNVVM